MTAPVPFADLGGDDYARWAARLGRQGFITDPWLDGQARFAPTPVVLPAITASALYDAAEAVAATLEEMGQLVAAAPSLLETFFHLSPVQRLMFQSSWPLWHGHARADVFLTSDGTPVVCELNCDTPSGQPEALALAQVAADSAGDSHLIDVTAPLARALVALVAGFVRRLDRSPGDGRTPAVGIVYPTELTEDLALIQFWRSTLERQGYAVVLGSPFNLHATPDGGVGLFGQPVDVVLRHYKTDWWGEREPLWDDEEAFPDPAPLRRPLRLLLDAERAGRCAVVNPFGAVLPQNKRSFAFLWEEKGRFSARAQATIEALIPYTTRLESADPAALRRDRAGWVLKSDYGCEGEEVLLGAALTDDEWGQALALARPHRFVVQRRFDPARDAAGRIANHGVFLVAGRAGGLYTRLSVGPTDRLALSVPTLVSDDQAGHPHG